MCNVSAVFDTYRPHFPPPNIAPSPYPWMPNPIPVQTEPTVIVQPYSPEQLHELIDSFKEAIEAAKVFDRVTGQPDCEDPDKARLTERVAELERRLEKLEAPGSQ